MGSCCSKAPVEEEEPPVVRSNHNKQQQHQHSANGSHHDPSKHTAGGWNGSSNAGPGQTADGTDAHHRNKEKEKSGEHGKPPVDAKATGRTTVPAVAERKKTTRVGGSNIKDNKETVPLGKRTDFGYERDFKAKYTLGKLLGHGQFGYTYVAVEKATGNKVAVKTIEKKQVPNSHPLPTTFGLTFCLQ